MRKTFVDFQILQVSEKEKENKEEEENKEVEDKFVEEEKIKNSAMHFKNQQNDKTF